MCINEICPSEQSDNPFLDQMPTSDDNVSLTDLVKKEETDTISIRSLSFNDDPYPDQTPTKVLSRRYLVGTFNVSTDQFFFPLALWSAIPSVKRYLSRFGLFKCDWLVDLEMVATPFWFGAVGVSVLPFQDASDSYKTVAQQVQSSMMLLDISTQQSAKLHLPYLRPLSFFSNTTAAQQDWRVGIHQFYGSDINLGGTIPLTFNVFVTAQNIHTAGFLPIDGELHSIVETRSPGARLARVATAASAVGSVAYTAVNKWFSGAVEKTVSDYTVNRVKDAVKAVRDGDPDVAEVNRPSENIKLDVFGDVSSPCFKSLSTATQLGDCRGFRSFLPGGNADTNISALVSRPAILSTLTFTDPADYIRFPSHPFLSNSYSQYIGRCFKYYRGSSRFIIYFFTSSMVSARFRVTIYPLGYVAGGDPVGDLPSWVVSVKGSTCVTLKVPYLNTTPWADVLNPAQTTVMIELIDTIAGPTAASKAIYTMIFGASDPDMKFAGYQSFRPGEFAGIWEDMGDDVHGESTQGLPAYQGGLVDLMECIARSSTRKPALEYSIPIPIGITSLNLQDLDNYDYLSSLFKFWTGESRVKMLFSAAPTTSLLQVTLQNSKQDAAGIDYAGSNGLAASAQPVWPVIDVVFPYLNIVPYNTVYDPFPVFAQTLDSVPQMQEFLICTTPNFELSYVMPVPDIDFEGSFHGRSSLAITYSGAATTTGTARTNNVLIGAFEEELTTLNYNFSVYRESGSNDTNFIVEIRDDLRATNVDFSFPFTDNHSYVSVVGRWSDTGTGADVYNFSGQSCFVPQSTSCYLTMSTDSTSVAGFKCLASVVLTPATQSATLVNMVDLENQGIVSFSNGSVYVAPLPGQIFPVSIDAATVTTSTNVVNAVTINDAVPIDVNVTTDPFLVSITNEPTVIVGNTSPIEVTATIDPSTVVSVQGIVDPVPVRVTYY